MSSGHCDLTATKQLKNIVLHFSISIYLYKSCPTSRCCVSNAVAKQHITERRGSPSPLNNLHMRIFLSLVAADGRKLKSNAKSNANRR